MAADVSTFADWLATAHVPETRLTLAQRHLLEAAFHFRQRCGTDYYSTRLLSHWLLHSHTGLKVTQIARLLGLSRSAASAQQGLSSKEVIQAAHHRLAGRAHGKLLPRYAGPVAQFLLEHPRASRYDVLDFIEQTWQVRVTRQALHKFLKKYALDPARGRAAVPDSGGRALGQPSASDPRPSSVPATPVTAAPATAAPATALPVPLPPREFFLPPPTTPAPSSCCPPPSAGSPPPRRASRTSTARCAAGC
jgi:hypothetical protein